MATPMIRTKANRLTRYGLACGYIGTFEEDKFNICMWHEDGPYIHVRLYDYNTHRRVFWESFETLTAARKCFDETKRRIKAGDTFAQELPYTR